MTRLALPATTPAVLPASSDTEELAWELQQNKPDTHRIKWLVEDMQADVTEALERARLKEHDLLKNPVLRGLGLQKYLKNRQ